LSFGLSAVEALVEVSAVALPKLPALNAAGLPPAPGAAVPPCSIFDGGFSQACTAEVTIYQQASEVDNVF